MKTTHYLKYSIVLLAAIASAITLFLPGCKKDKDTVSQQPPVIDVARPRIDSVVLYKTYPGILGANNLVEVVAEVSGRLLTKNYTSGSYVTKGQVLFTIESDKYADAVKRAQAALTTARSQHAYATKQHSAMKRALQADAVSQMEVIQAESSVEQSAAAIASAEASLADARTQFEKCVVRAPISGYITSATADPGAYINGGASPVVLAKIYDNSVLGLKFSIEDSQYELMTGGGGITGPLYRAVPIHFEKQLPHSYTADLFYEAPDVESSTGTLVLKGILQNHDNELKDGMYCTVQLPYGTNPKAILIRDASIGTDQLGKYIYVVNDSNKIVYTHIEVGDVYQDSMRIVNKGLAPDARYVTSALLKVRNGMKVKPRLIN